MTALTVVKDTVEPATPPKIKAPRYFPFTCPHCAEVSKIDRALLLSCPTCSTPPGAPCIDMRSKEKGKVVPLAKIHPARVAALNSPVLTGGGE